MNLLFNRNEKESFSLFYNGYGLENITFSIQLEDKTLNSKDAILLETTLNKYIYEWSCGIQAIFEVDVNDEFLSANFGMTIINNSNEPINILSASPICVDKRGLTLGNGIKDWILYKNGLRKNDTVCIYKFQDEKFELSELVGSGNELGEITYIEGKDKPIEINSQYLTVLKAESTGQSILIGSIQPTKEFSIHTFTCSNDEKEFMSLNISVLLKNKTLKPKERLELGQIMVSFESDFEAISHYADISSKDINVNFQEIPQLGWCSWYFFYENITQEKVLENAKIINKYQIPLEIMLIDMGWEQRLGDWHANHDFNKGMKWMADQIKSYGLKPGLWLSPFWVEPRSEVHRDHPEWLLKDEEGEPIIFRCHIDGFVIDTSISEACEWISNVFRRVSQEWGYEIVKVDFLRTVAIYENAKFTNKVTRAEALRLGMEAIRKGIGKEVVMIACGGQYGPTLGIADINRTSNDIRANWSSVRDTFKKNMLRYWMNKKWWINDPDCMIIRNQYEGNPGYMAGHRKDEKGSFSDLEVDTIFDLFNSLNGTFLLGDDLTQLSKTKLYMIKDFLSTFDKSSKGSIPRDLFVNRYPHILDKQIDESTHEVTIVNWEEEKEEIKEQWKLTELIGTYNENDKFMVTNLKTEKNLGIFKINDTISNCSMPLHGSIRLLIQKINNK